MKADDQLNQIPGEETNQEEITQTVETTETENSDLQTPVASIEAEISGDIQEETQDTTEVLIAEEPATATFEGPVEVAETAEPTAEIIEPDAVAEVTGTQAEVEKPVAELVETTSITEVAETAADVGEVTVPAIIAIVEGVKSHAHEEEVEEDEVAEAIEIDFNHLTREELVEALRNLVAEDDINSIKKRVSLIKIAFTNNLRKDHDIHIELHDENKEMEVKPVEEEEVVKNFNEVFEIYRLKRQRFLEDQEKQKFVNLEQKKLILEDLKNLIDSGETLKKTYDEFRSLQAKWKSIGQVPKNEINNLWQNYHFLQEKFLDKVRINKELRDLDLKKNMEAKLELCEKAEELLLENSIIKSFRQLQKLHETWKEIGPVPQDKRDELWERFRIATDKINERRKEHYSKLEEEQGGNYLAKKVLCEKAEALIAVEYKSVKEWQDSSHQVEELLKLWKTIGPAPIHQNEEIWERFRTGLSAYYSAKKDFFGALKEEQVNNYNLKLDLCIQAEALKSSTEWKKTTQELINLQNEWKKIGPVSRKHSDKIWKRFRSACDEFFNKKGEFFSNIDASETENLRLKEELVQKIENYEYTENKPENLEILKGFQREWTEIGHVPMNQKERIYNEFRMAINNQMDKLKINRSEIQAGHFREKYEQLKSGPNARKVISSEKSFLIGKRSKLEEEIKLLENNMGFLADSKNAQILKAEFEKKIIKAKEEIDLLSAKIKILAE